MIPIWLKILRAKTPEEFSISNWKKLRKIASNIYHFDREPQDKRITRLCNALGYSSISDIRKQREEASDVVDFLIEFEKQRWVTDLAVDSFCREHNFRNKDGTYSTGQTLRNKYHEYKKRVNMPTEELFELECGMTRQEFLREERNKKKIKISRCKPKTDS